MWMLWQQAVLIIVEIIFLPAYMTCTYLVVRERSLRAVLLRLVVMTAIGSAAWALCVLVFSALTNANVSDESVRNALIQQTYIRTLSLPFNIPEVFPELPQYLTSLGVRRALAQIALPVGLFTLSALVAGITGVLARTRYGVEKNKRLYSRALAASMAVLLTFLLWPQPSRNPEMQSVPIPNEAIAVSYAHTADRQASPMTTFSIENESPGQLLGYYRNVLNAAGWRLEQGEVYQEYPIGPGLALFSKGKQVLEVNVPGGPYGAYVKLTMRGTTPTELALLRQPTTSSAPAPVQTFGVPLATPDEK